MWGEKINRLELKVHTIKRNQAYEYTEMTRRPMLTA